MTEEIIEEKKPPKKKKGAKYIGKGNWLPGMPARDLSHKEWNKFPKKERDKAIKLGIYKE